MCILCVYSVCSVCVCVCSVCVCVVCVCVCSVCVCVLCVYSVRCVCMAYGVVVSMFDFHCSDRGSNPGRGGKIS